jgi:CheY-like chemotaxis protein
MAHPFAEEGAPVFTPPPIPPRVLVVQGHRLIRLSLLELLSEEGYAAFGAASLQEALSQLDEYLFDLILADLHVGKSPHSFTEAHILRRRAHATPLAILTSQPIAPEDAALHGFAFLIRAPFDLELLLAMVAMTIDQPLTPAKLRKAEGVQRYHTAIAAGDWKLLATLCTEDVTFYPPAKLSAAVGSRLRGVDALRAYLQEQLARLPLFSFEEMLIGSRPRGLVARYTATWIPPEARRRRMTGVALYQFRGRRIAQIGVGWNTERLHALLDGAQHYHRQTGG